MLVEAMFKLKNEDRLYAFNPENVLYIDCDGVLFAKDVYRLFADDNQFDEVMEQAELWMREWYGDHKLDTV